MTSNIDHMDETIRDSGLYDDATPGEPRVDPSCETEGPGKSTIGAAIGGSAIGAIAGTLIGGPIGTALGATLGGVGGAMIGRATEGGDDHSDPRTGAPVDLGLDETDRIDAGPFDNPASYDETAAEVAKDREVLVGDDPGYVVVESNQGTEERLPASPLTVEDRMDSAVADELH